MENILGTIGICFWKLPNLALYPVTAIALVVLLLRCFWDSLLACPGVLIGRNL